MRNRIRGATVMSVAALTLSLPTANASASERGDQRAAAKDLHQKVVKRHGADAAGRNIARYGVRFVWSSKDNKRHHWAARSATTKELRTFKQQLARLLRPAAIAVPPPQPPAGTATAGSSPIPQYIVDCESGGSYTAVNPSSGAYGKYQIMPFHWSSGICRDLDRSPAGQDQCAARIWKTSGAGAWVCS
jgi:hypothetical protein